MTEFLEPLLQYFRNPTENLEKILTIKESWEKKVILAKDKKEYRYIIKVYRPKNFQYEHDIAKAISSLQNVESYVNHCFTISFDPILTIVYKLETGITLEEALKTEESISNPDAWKISKKLLTIIKNVHALKISHNDIKLSNIIINTNDEIILIDWEFGRFWEDDNRQPCGSPKFAAPEVLEEANDYTWHPDIWSTAVVIYILFIKRFPFNGTSRKKLYAKIKSYNVDWRNMPSDIGLILQTCFVPYQYRSNAQSLLHILKKVTYDN
jgi:serine/threonine protein kinase